MTKILIAATFVLTISLFWFSPTSAQVTLPAKIKSDIETIVSANTVKIQSFQETYKLSKARYMQVLWSHTDAPSSLTLATNLTTKPTYQDEDTQYFFDSLGLTKTLPMRLKVDIYDGPAGQGYVLSVEVTYNAQLFSRQWNFGSEMYRSTNWFEVKLLAP